MCRFHPFHVGIYNLINLTFPLIDTFQLDQGQTLKHQLPFDNQDEGSVGLHFALLRSSNAFFVPEKA